MQLKSSYYSQKYKNHKNHLNSFDSLHKLFIQLYFGWKTLPDFAFKGPKCSNQVRLGKIHSSASTYYDYFQADTLKIS